MGHDTAQAKPVSAMSIRDINEKNENLWGNVGPAESQEAAPELAGTRVARNVPVWTGSGIGDEVQPTQSDPPDGRSDNLLGEAAVAGERDAETPAMSWMHNKTGPENLSKKDYPAWIAAKNSEVAKKREGMGGSKKSGDDLAQGTESMPPEGQADAATKTVTENVKGKELSPGHPLRTVKTETTKKPGPHWMNNQIRINDPFQK